MRIYIFSLLAFMVLFSGCAKTTVVLLPDSDNSVGQVTVATEGGTRVLDKPHQYTEVSSAGSSPSAPREMKGDKMEGMFGRAMAVMPEKPVSFLLYFKFNSDELTDESAALIPEVLEAARKRQPCDISIIGHSDSMGPAEYNIRLSLERAEKVLALLTKEEITVSEMDVRSHGENDQLIKTEDNVSEPKNRRVEIMVK